jgi:hypothetical protein
MTADPTLTITMAKRIELWPLDRLKPYSRNARTHSPEQVAQIAASIVEFGFTNPILVDSNDGIIAGHGRLTAAQDLGLKTVPVVVLDHLSERQRKAYVIADNQLALNAGWDTDLLQAEVMALSLADFNLDLLGFDDDIIADLIDPEGIDSNNENGSIDENPYTSKTDIPPYEITGPKPELASIYDDAKTIKLIKEIDASNLTEDEKHLLRAAAYRHVVFNFQSIAEYYAHSNAQVQKLMEDSAMVIVDIGKAIQEGWAKLSNELDSAYEQDYPEDEKNA